MWWITSTTINDKNTIMYQHNELHSNLKPDKIFFIILINNHSIWLKWLNFENRIKRRFFYGNVKDFPFYPFCVPLNVRAKLKMIDWWQLGNVRSTFSTDEWTSADISLHVIPHHILSFSCYNKRNGWKSAFFLEVHLTSLSQTHTYLFDLCHQRDESVNCLSIFILSLLQNVIQ